jgi:hypothetical protein
MSEYLTGLSRIHDARNAQPLRRANRRQPPRSPYLLRPFPAASCRSRRRSAQSHMTRRFIIALTALAMIGTVLGLYASNPLRRTDGGVERWLQSTTPLGSSLSDVESIVTSRGWFRYHGSSGSHDGPWQFAETYVRGYLGEYQGLPFRTSVTAFWEFDASNRLTQIRIWKTRDGL